MESAALIFKDGLAEVRIDGNDLEAELVANKGGRVIGGLAGFMGAGSQREAGNKQ